MATFVGLDLAWTSRFESGLCVLEGDASGAALRSVEARVFDTSALAAAITALGPDVVAAVDAPLVVTPERCAERQLARVFGRYRAAAYSANPAFLAKMDGLAGPCLAAALSASGFALDPSRLAPREPGRHAFEMYPHAAHVVLFGLDQRLPYKRGPLAQRAATLRVYQAHLAAACEAAGLGPSAALSALLDPTAVPAASRALKHLEDQLDALTCALVARRAWLLGAEALAVFGCEHGHIVTPGLPPGATMPPAACITCAPAPSCPSARAPAPARSSPPVRAAAAPSTAPRPP